MDTPVFVEPKLLSCSDPPGYEQASMELKQIASGSN